MPIIEDGLHHPPSSPLMQFMKLPQNEPRTRVVPFPGSAESAESPSLPDPVPGATRWERLGRGVWKKNLPLMEMSDTPEWLEPIRALDGLTAVPEDAALPLRFGIDPIAHQGAAMGLQTTLFMQGRLKTQSPKLLRFPPGEPESGPVQVRTRVPVEDGVLPFRLRVRRKITIFSLVGGTGRTSIAANVARILAGNGLRVLLADTCAHSLLPRHFGAGDTRQGVIRNFIPVGPVPGPGADDDRRRRISLVSLAVGAFAGDDAEQFRILEELARDSARMDRVIWDLSGAPLDWAAKVLPSSPLILVPVLPNINSLVQLRATERFLNCCHDEDPAPHIRYVLNDFDEREPLHVQMRDCFRRQLGSRMLQVALRRSPLVDESLSLGKTVIDFAPESPLADDLLRMTEQLGQLAPGGGEALRIPLPLDWQEQ